MTELKTTIDFFKNQRLNEVGAELIDLYRKYTDDMQIIQQKTYSAVERRFMAGKFVSENHADIISECGTQRAFGEQLGLSEAVISNDKRSYEALADEGITEVEDLIPHLKKKGIPAFTKNWERLPKLLNDPDSLHQKDQRPKDEKILEDAYQSIKEVQQRNEGSTHNNIEAEAKHLLEDIVDLKKHLDKLNPYSYLWTSEKYKQWCRNLGICMITKNPCTPEFHHTDPKGNSGGEGKKLPDVFGFPVAPDVHRKIEDGSMKVSSTQIATALIETMSLFIMNQFE